MNVRAVPAIAAILALLGCGGDPDAERGRPDMTRRPLSAIIAERAPALMEIPGVVGVYEGLCDDAPCLRIMVRELSDSLLARLPREVEGYPVEIEETGEIRPLDGS